jgi:hypothetical protein
MYDDVTVLRCSKRDAALQVSASVFKKRPTYAAKETYKEAYVCDKTDLRMRQKRPTYAAKETYICDKTGLRMRQRSPTYEAKETYVYDKRDLSM